MEENAAQSDGTFLDLFKYPNMRKKTLIIWFNWYVKPLDEVEYKTVSGTANG